MCWSESLFAECIREGTMFSTPYIAGKTIDVPPSALCDVVNPANQRPFARIFMAKAEHMRAAIDAADAPKASWAAAAPAERHRILHRPAYDLDDATPDR